MRSVERPGARKELARDAGMGSVSGISVAAGVLVAYGALALLATIVAGVSGATGIDGDDDVTLVALGVAAAGSWFFGGYVAGRMGRRAGLVHGVAVFVLGLVVAAVVALAAWDTVTDWRDVGLLGGAGLLLTAAVGSVLGGAKGERWHGLLVTRARDPHYGPAAERARELERELEDDQEPAPGAERDL